MTRKEECRFTTPLHDLRWQDDITAQLDHLIQTNQTLLAALQSLHEHLGLPEISVPPPPVAPPRQRARSERTPPAPDPTELAVSHTATTSAEAALAPPPLPLLEPELDFLTQSGAEWLLAQSYAQSHLPVPSIAPATLDAAQPSALVSAVTSADVRVQIETEQTEPTTGFFGMVDWVIGSDGEDEDGGSDETRTMRERLVGSANLGAIGSQDPRMDVVKAGVVTVQEAEHLLDL